MYGLETVKPRLESLQHGGLSKNKIMRRRRKEIVKRTEEAEEEARSAAEAMPFHIDTAIVRLLQSDQLLEVFNKLNTTTFDDPTTFFRCKLEFGLCRGDKHDFVPFVEAAFGKLMQARMAAMKASWTAMTQRPQPMTTNRFRTPSGDVVSMTTLFSTNKPHVVSETFTTQEVQSVQLRFWHTHAWFPKNARVVLYLQKRLETVDTSACSLESVTLTEATAASTGSWRFRALRSWTGATIASAAFAQKSSVAAHSVEIELQNYETYFQERHHTPLFAAASLLRKAMSVMLGAQATSSEAMSVTIDES